MAQQDWLSVLGWSEEELDDLRFVGYSYIRQGKYDIALTFFEALTVLCPDSTYDLQTLGGIYLQINNNVMALNYLEKALKKDPSHLPTLLNRAKALLALGYKKQALTQAKLLESCTDEAIASQAQAILLAHTERH